MPLSRPRIALSPGTRVSRRGGGLLHLGIHEDRRLVLPDDPAVRRLLALLEHGVDPVRLPPQLAAPYARIEDAGLLVPVDAAAVRDRHRRAARIGVAAPDPTRASLRRLLAAAGLVEATPRGRETVRLLVSTGAEPRRERLDEAMRADRPHLVVTEVAGRIRLGPCVVPGLTACLRCVDEHLTDRDPRHPLVVEQHLRPDPADRAPAPDRQLGLAWAVRDLVALVDGDRPTTWSATVELRGEGPVSRRWARHPRCGCAWGDALAG